MFTDCPYCGFLVALDAGGQPLPRCPNCAQRLRSDGDDTAREDANAATTQGADHVHGPDDAEAEAAGIRAAAAAPVTPPATDRAGTRDDMPVPAAAHDAGTAAPLPAADPAQEPDAAATGAGSAPPLPDEPVPAVAAPIATHAPAPAAATSEAGPAEGPHPEAATAPAAGDAPAVAAMTGDDATPAEAAHDPAVGAHAGSPMDDHAPASFEAPAPPAPRVRARHSAAPSFVRTARVAPVASRRRRALEAAALVALSLLLAVQLLVADRARLAGDARWRPLVAALCGALGCALPAWREPTAFRVIERDVRARGAGVLRVSARIRNDARWAQPWPALQLTLSDAHGRDVATRIFQPREYLGGAPTQSGLASGQDAALSMDIVEPGPHAVAFTFDFL